MTTDQRLERIERIESLLECLLKVQKIQAREIVTHVERHKGDHFPGMEGHTREMYGEISEAIPIEHPKPAPESNPDSTAGAPLDTDLFRGGGGSSIHEEYPMTISVTQKHIDAGVKMDCENCPIAKALKEATGHHAIVDQDCICWTPYLRHDVIPPPAVREFIDRFDEGLPVEPFTFELEAT